MAEQIVSIRIPSSLVAELKKTVDKEHFKDLSELVRTAVRKKFLDSQRQPDLGLLTKEQLIAELERIISQLKR